MAGGPELPIWLGESGTRRRLAIATDTRSGARSACVVIDIVDRLSEVLNEADVSSKRSAIGVRQPMVVMRDRDSRKRRRFSVERDYYDGAAVARCPQLHGNVGSLVIQVVDPGRINAPVSPELGWRPVENPFFRAPGGWYAP